VVSKEPLTAPKFSSKADAVFTTNGSVVASTNPAARGARKSATRPILFFILELQQCDGDIFVLLLAGILLSYHLIAATPYDGATEVGRPIPAGYSCLSSSLLNNFLNRFATYTRLAT
jgi:hypothetical protein